MEIVRTQGDRLLLSLGKRQVEWGLPSFPLTGGEVRCDALLSRETAKWRNGWEYTLRYSLRGSPAQLIVILRARADVPFARLQYRLQGDDHFAGLDGVNRICYGRLYSTWSALTEVQLSQFDRIHHSFSPAEETYSPQEALHLSPIGPIIALETPVGELLTAYEHGASAPDSFLHFEVASEGLILWSSKGNYFGGQAVDNYRAPWIELGAAEDLPELRRAYREFARTDLCDNEATRKPFIFYNTWHHQEGMKRGAGQTYLQDLNSDFILKDIETAHQMGVEVYVIDTGWFARTGDWEVNESFFPQRMQAVREKLAAYKMQLGLWLNPVSAAVGSCLYAEQPGYVLKRGGVPDDLGKIWETEESYGMCLASGYAELFIENLVRLHDELGVTYFKWDAVGQYGCDSAHHLHGGAENGVQERRDAYAYRMGLEMIRVAQELGRRRPGTICDFDITEDGRFVGLGFLSAGKYFSINNGPYFSNFDIPESDRREPDMVNVFFYPGPARAQVCRRSALYDEWIPSVLFLTHYLPHGDARSQRNNMAALALGGNGIWGYLWKLSREDVENWAAFLEQYKCVRDAMTRAYPIVRGYIGGSPEIHEKLEESTGTGAVVCFTKEAASVRYVTRPLQREPERIEGADRWKRLPDGRYLLELFLGEDDARVVFFLG